MFIFDAHCDTITTALAKGQELFRNNCHIDFERLLKFNSPVQIFSVWLDKQKLDDPFRNTINAIDFFKRQVNKNSDFVGIVHNYSDLLENIQNKKISAILGIEGGEAFQGDYQNIYKLFDYGVRVFTLTWNYENEIGFGTLSESQCGLKTFGKEALKILNSLNAIVDVSHINENGFWDVCKIYQKPFIASHSNSKKICHNNRNLTDEQIIEISKRNGMIGINLYPDFLSKNKEADVDSIIEHIEHILNITSENVIGLGCDFDGIDKTPSGIYDISSLFDLYDKVKSYFGEDNSNKFFGLNFLRFFKDNFY